MQINKKRIYSLNNNLPNSLRDKVFVPAIILDATADKKKIFNLGFTEKMEIGETLLPSSVGAVSRFNTEGRDIPDKTKPKVTKYYEVEWTRKEWAGRGQTRDVTSIITRSRQVWQRNFIPPPSISLSITKKEDGKVYISTPKTKFTSDEEDALHKINLILEIFDTCYVLNEESVPILKNSILLNWKVLPPGKRPWKEQKKELEQFFNAQKSKNVKPVLESRLEEINELQPEFTAIGNQGYRGYVVFGFPKKKIYILESAFYGNAIYVFKDDWEGLSKKTKAEILNAKLQLIRITHTGEKINWLEKIRGLLK